MFSKKTIYGLKATLVLAKNYDQGSMLITDLARKEKIPQKFLEAILLELRKRDILNSKKGKGGGYFLAKSPSEVTLGEIIRVLEGPLALPDIKSPDTSEILTIIKEVRDAMSNILDKTTLADVIERGQAGKYILNYVI